MAPKWLTQLLYDLQLEAFCKRAGCTGSCSNCTHPTMLPSYSPPPVSPTHGDQIEVSMLTPGAQEPDLVSSSKTRQGTQFGPGATSATGQFPLRQHPVRGQGTHLDLRCLILISPQEPQVTLTVGNKLIDYLPYLS